MVIEARPKPDTETLVTQTVAATALVKAKLPRLVVAPIIGRLRTCGGAIDPEITPTMDTLLASPEEVAGLVIAPLDMDRPPASASPSEASGKTPAKTATSIEAVTAACAV